MFTLQFEKMGYTNYCCDAVKASAGSVELHITFKDAADVFVYLSDDDKVYNILLPLREANTRHDIRLTNVAGKYIWIITNARPASASCIN